jgi:polyether ionophore transport system permease protein
MDAEALASAQGSSRLGSIYGLGSVFGKGLRDSRRAVIGVGVGVGLIVLVTASQIAIQFPTQADRQQLAASMASLPAVVRGLLGEPINIDRLGGFLSWRLVNFLPVMIGLWSILALSGTLAGEAARGSLDVLAATGISRVRLAVEKAVVHIVGLGMVVIVLALVAWLSGVLFGRLPGDEIALSAALSHFAGVGLVSLVGGAVAFALAPILGRSAAAGIGAVALLAAYIINSYAPVLPSLAAIQGLSWFGWTAGHRPIAGVSDPVSLLGVAVLNLALLVAGVLAFVRRDIGATVALPSLGVPGAGSGLSGPAARSFAARLPGALAWGLGIGGYGLLIAASASGFTSALSQVPGIARMIEALYPGIDYRSAGGVLQLAFYTYALLFAGLGVAVLVSGWASDERERRLDVVLAGPISRGRWVLASGAGLLGAVAVMTLITALLVALGALIEGDDPSRPFVGALVVGLYAAALTGIGVAAGGLFGPGIGAGTTGGLALGFFLLDLLGSALRLPDAILQLSLIKHLGQPIIGTFDGVGMVFCLVLASGGVAVGAVGLSRRDLRL